MTDLIFTNQPPKPLRIAIIFKLFHLLLFQSSIVLLAYFLVRSVTPYISSSLLTVLKGINSLVACSVSFFEVMFQNRTSINYIMLGANCHSFELSKNNVLGCSPASVVRFLAVVHKKFCWRFPSEPRIMNFWLRIRQGKRPWTRTAFKLDT